MNALSSERVTELIRLAKDAKLSTKDQIEIGYELEQWRIIATRCERAIHQLVKETE